MKEIPLTGGYTAIVDDEDFERVSQFKWFAEDHRHTMYAKRNVRREDGGWTSERLHRFILGPPDGIAVDHIDRNGLNNRRENLRIATASENQHNRGKAVNNTSGYIGVSWHKKSGKWQAMIKVNGGAKHLGLFACPVAAAKARDKAAIELHGEFASLNFPDEYYEENIV
jgi:hypothetical protein